LKRNNVKRHLQKKRNQKQAQETAKKTKTAGEKIISAVKKIGGAAVNFVISNPKVILILAIALLLVIIILSCVGMALTLLNGLSGAISAGTSYLAADGDIDEAELRYTEWEADIYLQALNAEISHEGYDEYIFNLATPTHDPYALLAYLTVKYGTFTFAMVQAEMQNIFNQQYTLTFTPSVEIRQRMEERTETWTDEDGVEHTETYEVEVDYEWNILTVTLTAQRFEDVIKPLLNTKEEKERYEIYMLTKGNRQYVGNLLKFNWLSYVSCGYGYRINPTTGEKKYSTGVDIAVPAGTPIIAGGMGTVIESGNSGMYGLNLLIDYGKGIQARYAYCSALYYNAGQTVKTGDIIALSGDSLYVEITKNGRYLNPLFFMDGTR